MANTAVKFFIEYIKALQIQYLFGIPGRAIMPLYNALYDNNFPIPILSCHESGAAFMATCWSILSRKPGLCCATTGPGATNMLTGVATAYSESVPLIVITGQTPISNFNSRSYQESFGFSRSVNTVELFKEVTKRSGVAFSASQFVDLLINWIPVACEGRAGPIHIAVPWDVWDKPVSDCYFDKSFFFDIRHKFSTELCDDDAHYILKSIKNSDRSLMIIGRGVTCANAGHQAIKFSKKTGIPIVTTVRGKGAIPCDDKYCLGHLGPSAKKGLLEWIKNSRIDTILSVGSSLGPMALGELPAICNKPKLIIQVNIDCEERGVLWKADRFIKCDAFEFFYKMYNISQKREYYVDYKENLPSLDFNINVVETEGLHPGFVLKVIYENFPKDTIYLPDCGIHWLWSMFVLKNREINSILPGRSFGAMGQATAGAIGAKLACPNKTIVCITGDGSFLMHGNEIATAVEKKLDINWIVFNNRALGRIYIAQKCDFQGKIISSKLPKIKYSEIAKSFGLHSEVVANYKQLPLAIGKALRYPGPFLLEILISKEIPPP